MAIGPQDARKLWTAEMNQVKRLEKQIDAYLTTRNGRRGIEESFSSQEVVNQAVLDELVRRYKAAGWKEVTPTLNESGFAIRFANPSDHLD